MNLKFALTSSLTVAALVAAPLFSAYANPSSITGRCEFDAGDQEQGDDCWVGIRACVRNGPPASSPECRDFMRVRCGERTLFAGEFDTDHHGDRILLKGIPNDRYHKPAFVGYEEPHDLPDTVHAKLRWGNLDRHGKCHFRYEGRTPMAAELE